ncbi:MAG: minor capsid protein [Muribaculum sp.]|nr:minor capsid protein [Muribaculum sp.]
MKILVKTSCDFNLKDCIKRLGLDDGGRVQRFVAEEVRRLSDEYVPLDEGTLRDSGRIENNSEVVWNTPYAVYMWNGIVYEDPELHCAGFKTENGWRSRKGVKKVPTARSLEYGEGIKRGARWVFRMLQDGGRQLIEKAARKEAGK